METTRWLSCESVACIAFVEVMFFFLFSYGVLFFHLLGDLHVYERGLGLDASQQHMTIPCVFF